MATGTVYLDIDDEITSAAARIRGSAATKVALVVPNGSRISTSRMNFRLLSREALVNNRRLSIIASDPATRALAASAGLPVYQTVSEFESAAEASRATTEAEEAGAGEEASAEPEHTFVTPPARPRASRSRAKPLPPPVSDDTEAVGFAPAAVVAAAPAPAGFAPPSAAADAARARIPVIRSRRLPPISAPVIVIGAAAILSLVVIAVVAFVYLPSAKITITPKQEAIEPISLVVRADPDATAPDAASGVVPAVRVEIPIQVSDTFTTTGTRVEKAAATGSVTFQNFNFLASNTIPKGSIVSTEGGIKFRTVRQFTLAKAQLVLPGGTVIPSKGTIGVTAVETGTTGNVPANAIRVVPPGENPDFTTVNNPAPTSGGKRDEFKQVSQADLDAAAAALQKKVDAAFATAVQEGTGAPAGTTVFPETALLGPSTPSVDPATLLGQEVETFDLGMTAAGTVLAVDSSPVEDIARARLLANVGSGYRLLGEPVIEPGDPTVADGDVLFPVTASGTRVLTLDGAELLAQVKGLSVEAAEAKLAPFGDVKIVTWPDWVSSIPSIDARVSLEVVGQGDAAGAGAGAGATASPAARDSAAPSDSGGP